MEELLKYSPCRLCPRQCGADRENGKYGFCGVGSKLKLARASLHMWEEPCVSGERGSGTVFFSGCSLGCVYCQNGKISHGECGKEIDGDRLVEIFFELKEKGAHNINLVTPSHYVPSLVRAIERAKTENIGIPFVYNSSSYEYPEALSALDGLIDVYLPDFKYTDSELARRYSFAPDYPEVAKRAIAEMVSQQPNAEFDESGLIKRGVIVRHLVLPHAYENSRAAIEYLYKTYGNSIYMSIMSQYTPVCEDGKYPELADKVRQRDYERLIDYALEIGVENGFTQEGEASDESFIPDFDSCEGVLLN